MELMIVVAIIAVAAAVVSMNITRARARQEIQREIRAIRVAIEKTRALAMNMGARVGTTRLNVLGTCTGVSVLPGGLPHPVIWIDPPSGQYNYPTSYVLQANNEVLDVGCQTVTIGNSGGVASAVFDGALQGGTLQFGFTSSGRLIAPAGADIYIRLLSNDPNEPQPPGLRVLPSGVVCESTNPGPGGRPCDEDL